MINGQPTTTDEAIELARKANEKLEHTAPKIPTATPTTTDEAVKKAQAELQNNPIHVEQKPSGKIPTTTDEVIEHQGLSK